MNRIKDLGALRRIVFCSDFAKTKTLDFSKLPAKSKEETPRCATAGTEDSQIKVNQAGVRPKMRNS